MNFTIEDRSTFDEVVIQRGIDAYNRAHGYEPVIELAAFVYDDANRVCGGVYGELVWNWLYIDLLWVDNSARGRGCGRQLVSAIEQEAQRRGVNQVYLATTSFQALPFYYHVGYRLFGVLEDRPPGYQYYYLQRTVEPQNTDHLPAVTEDFEPDDFAAVRQGLSAYNRSRGVNPDGRRLSVYMRDDEQHNYGGMIAATYWGWLDIQLFWLDESHRGQGYGTQILEMAEREALARGCQYAFADVADFQALDFFLKHGYTSFAILPDRPPGHATHFLRKALVL